MIIFDKFIEKYLGKEIDFDGAYAGQCVDLFRQYVKEVLGYPQPKVVKGAADFWDNFDTDPNLKNYYTKIIDGQPQKGDVIIWNRSAGGGFGHISVFIESKGSKFVSFDQNWPTLSKCTKTEHDFKNVYGWLRPNSNNVIISPPTSMIDYQKIWDNTGNIKGLENREEKPDFYAPDEEFKKAWVDTTTNDAYVVVKLKSINDTLSYLRDEISKRDAEIVTLNQLSELLDDTTGSAADYAGTGLPTSQETPKEPQIIVNPPLPNSDPDRLKRILGWCWNKISQLWRR